MRFSCMKIVFVSRNTFPINLKKVYDAFRELVDFAEEEGGFYMKTMVSELQVEVEERLKEIFI